MREAAAHDVAKAAGMHPMNVSRAVASLTRAGRISARRDVDGRRKILALTSEGLELHKALLPHVRRVAELMSDSMSSLEAEFFAKLLAKLVERLDSLALTDTMLIDTVALTQVTGLKSPTIAAVPSKKSSIQSMQVGTNERRRLTTNTRKSNTPKETSPEGCTKLNE
jgi:DNA-binding MarR family transcriptional regulator